MPKKKLNRVQFDMISIIVNSITDKRSNNTDKMSQIQGDKNLLPVEDDAQSEE